MAYWQHATQCAELSSGGGGVGRDSAKPRSHLGSRSPSDSVATWSLRHGEGENDITLVRTGAVVACGASEIEELLTGEAGASIFVGMSLSGISTGFRSESSRDPKRRKIVLQNFLSLIYLDSISNCLHITGSSSCISARPVTHLTNS